jgi:muconolactone delta-isomerase
VAGKFLVLWRLELSRLTPEAFRAILRQQDHGATLESEGKVLSRYHLVGEHGGAWIYEVASNEELDALLARSPVYNIARYEVHALAEMHAPSSVPASSPEAG